jgi:hypothetical protein
MFIYFYVHNQEKNWVGIEGNFHIRLAAIIFSEGMAVVVVLVEIELESIQQV